MTVNPLKEAAHKLRATSTRPPEIGLVLGSGLGAFGDTLQDLQRIPYEELPHMPSSTVAGHAGNLCLGRVGSVQVACLQGRVHCYEGHSADTAAFGACLLAELGCQCVLLTNAAGGISEHLAPGDLMLISDHINLMGKNPLVGPNDPVGPRFPDMTQAYNPKVRAAAQRAAAQTSIGISQGVYAAMLGPSYETPAEIRMLKALGADAVGMSTVPEVIALRHRGILVGAMSCITNKAAGITGATLDHAEVEEIARGARERFVSLLGAWIGEVAHLLADDEASP